MMLRMGAGVLAGRALGGAAVVASLLVACGGESQFSSGDDSGEAEGGTAPVGGSSSGGSGGASPSGGVGGIVPPSTGGAPACPACPDANYGLAVEGDGAPYTMRYEGYVDAAADRAPSCPETPLRGTVGGCVRSIGVSACLGPMSGRPCLEIGGAYVRYVDRQGELFTGYFTSDVPSDAAPGVETGTIEVVLTSDTGRTLDLTIGYAFCATYLGNIKIVC